MTLAEMLAVPIEWFTIDNRPLSEADGTHPNDDDFHCRWHGLYGRAEQMTKYSWYYAVYLGGLQGQAIHFWTEDGIYPRTGEGAMMLVEAFMIRYIALQECELPCAIISEDDGAEGPDIILGEESTEA